MLTPRALQSLPDAIVNLYYDVETAILANMALRISAYDYWIPAADWQAQKLMEAGRTREEIIKAMSSITGKSQTELQHMMQQAGTETLLSDGKYYAGHNLTVPNINDSEPLLKILKAGYNATNQSMRNLTQTTANTATKQFEDALDHAWGKIQSGAFDTNSAIRSAIKELSAQGIGAIRYPSGRIDSLDVAVRRAVVTGVNQTAAQLQLELAAEMDSDLVETTAHGGARPSHAQWQGRVFSLSGRNKKYPEFRSATGYGTGAGLCGWNCRHSFHPYFEGTRRANSEKELQEYEAESFTYNGQRITEYQATQMQREIERNIRRWKREEAAMKAVGLDTGESRAQLRKWQEKQNDFLQQTGLKRQYDREGVAKIGSGVILKDIETKRIAVTNQSIQRVQLIGEDVLSPKIAQTLQERHKELLEYVRSAPVGTEAIQYYDLNGNLLDRYMGTKDKVVTKPMNRPYMASHNHPDGLTFSHADVENFILDPYLQVVSAVGNNGTVYLLSKTDDYNAAEFAKYYAASTQNNPHRMDSVENYIRWITELLEGGKKYGVVYIRRST